MSIWYVLDATQPCKPSRLIFKKTKLFLCALETNQGRNLQASLEDNLDSNLIK